MKGYIPDGVCPKLTIRETHKTKRKVLRDIFDADDLKAIFLCDEFASDRIGTQRRTPTCTGCRSWLCLPVLVWKKS